eukprot:scaffold29718_cov52-Attheya_sp.AAC.2
MSKSGTPPPPTFEGAGCPGNNRRSTPSCWSHSFDGTCGDRRRRIRRSDPSRRLGVGRTHTEFHPRTNLVLPGPCPFPFDTQTAQRPTPRVDSDEVHPKGRPRGRTTLSNGMPWYVRLGYDVCCNFTRDSFFSFVLVFSLFLYIEKSSQVATSLVWPDLLTDFAYRMPGHDSESRSEYKNCLAIRLAPAHIFQQWSLTPHDATHGIGGAGSLKCSNIMTSSWSRVYCSTCRGLPSQPPARTQCERAKTDTGY